MSAEPPISPLSRPTPARLRGVREGSLERALVAILAFALLLGVAQLGAGLAFSEQFWVIGAFTAVFWTWTVAGVVAWWRRPANGVGALIVLGGLAIYVGGIGNVPAPVFAVINGVFATSVLAVTVHILHAFPSGRLRGIVSIATVTGGYVVAIGLDVLVVAWPPGHPGAIRAIQFSQTLLGLAVMIVTAFVLARRLIAADRAHRRLLLPLFAYGIISVLLVPIIPIIVNTAGIDPAVSGALQLTVLAGLPIAFLLGVLLGGFRRTTALETLTTWLAVGGATGPAVARAIAVTLGDDSVRVVYPSAEREAYVDASGAVVERNLDDPEYGWIDVRVDGRLAGAIGYDTRLTADSRAVRRAGEVLAIAIERERLTAELLATNDELMTSRQRLVEATYLERTRIARDLHDGLQMQLVLLALEAQTIANSPDATAPTSAASEQLRRGIDRAAADLRHLVHNVLPAPLLEQGLTAAAEDLVDRLEMPATLESDLDESGMPRATAHTAYFVLAELLANAVKHSRANEVAVGLHREASRLVMEVVDDGVGGARVSGGTGLRGLVDRVSAIDGSIAIASQPGEGTRVRVELPCE